MKRRSSKPRAKPRAPSDGKRAPSPLGRELRRLSEQVVASGVKLLSLEEIRREVAKRRGADT